MKESIRTNILLKKIYILSILLLPILFLYSSNFLQITIGDLFLFAMMVLILILSKKIRIKVQVIYLLIYIVIITLINFFLIKEDYKFIGTTLRYLFYLINIMLLVNVYDLTLFAIKTYKIICIFAGCILCIQYICLKAFNYCLPGIILSLNLTDNSLYNYNYAVMYTNSQRCMSVFAEPSHYVIYILPCVLICLFDKKEELNNILCAIFLTLTILLSSTFTGLAGIFFIWGIWIAYKFSHRKISKKIILLVIILIVLFIYILFKFDVNEYIFNYEIYSRQSKGRFSGFNYIIKRSDDLISIVFGNGMIDIGEEVYLSGWARMFYYYGVIGSILYLYAYISGINKKSIGMLLMLLCGIMMIGTEMNFGPFILMYYLLIFLLGKDKYNKNKLSGTYYEGEA